MLRMLNPTQRTTTRRMKLSRKWKDDFVHHMPCVRLHVFVFFSFVVFFFVRQFVVFVVIFMLSVLSTFVVVTVGDLVC